MAKQTRSMQTSMIYLGGLIGPFSTQSMVAVVPEIASTYGQSVGRASMAVTIYMFTLATTMLFSSSIVRWQAPDVVVRVAYTITALGAAVCLISSSWAGFLVGVVLMALSNAFTLPVLQLILREIVPANQLGEALGRYFAMQSLGNCLGPFAAGMLALIDWQFIHPVVVMLALCVVIVGVPHLPPIPRTEEDGAVAWKPMVVHILTILALGSGIIGMSTVLTIHLDAEYGMPAAQRGLVIMAGGLVAFFVAPRIGASVDRLGALKVMALCSVCAAIAVSVIPLVSVPLVIAALWATAVSCGQGIQTTVTYSVLRTPGGKHMNSVILAFRFFGLALTPIIFLPAYQWEPRAGFGLPAVCVLAALALQWAQRPKASAGRSSQSN